VGRREMDGKAREGEKAGRNSSQWSKRGRNSWNKARKFTRRRDVWGAVAAATWFESLAVASRPLQRHPAETNFSDRSEKFPRCLRERLSQLYYQHASKLAHHR